MNNDQNSNPFLHVPHDSERDLTPRPAERTAQKTVPQRNFTSKVEPRNAKLDDINQEHSVRHNPQRQQVEHAAQIDQKIADKIAREKAEAEARRHYHEAWQNYYQQYYQHYYLQQLEAQKQQILNSVATQNQTKIDTETPQLSAREQAVAKLRQDLLDKIKTNANKATRSIYFKPIAIGVIVLLLGIFIQYNQLFSASWQSLISPKTQEYSTVIISGSSQQAISQEPTVIIPKINVKAPIIFDIDDQSDSASLATLNDGVIHFPLNGASSIPGQTGNTVVVGHSSSDVFNSGSYKFIFVQLNRLALDDLFYIDYNGTRYTYQIVDKKIIAKDAIGNLQLGNDKAYATLVTCDPPGTDWNRLIVIGEQISPNTISNSTQITSGNNSENLPGKSPTIFERLFR